MSATGPKIPIPALLTRMSTPPARFSTSRNSRCTDSYARTSQATPNAAPPTSRAASSAAPAARAVSPTVAPSRARATAIPRPMPRFPPVTTATLPLRKLTGIPPRPIGPNESAARAENGSAALALSRAGRLDRPEHAPAALPRLRRELDLDERARSKGRRGTGEMGRQPPRERLMRDEQHVAQGGAARFQRRDDVGGLARGQPLPETLGRRSGGHRAAHDLRRLARAQHRRGEDAVRPPALLGQARGQRADRAAAGGRERPGRVAPGSRWLGLAVAAAPARERPGRTL